MLLAGGCGLFLMMHTIITFCNLSILAARYLEFFTLKGSMPPSIGHMELLA